MRLQLKFRLLVVFAFVPFAVSQSVINVGDGAPTSTIREEFLTAYQRSDFFASVALPPLNEVSTFGSGGYRQEFQDVSLSGVRYALIRPANPDLNQGLANAVRQVRPPIYSLYTQSGVGVSTAGFPNRDTTRFVVQGSDIVTNGNGGSYQTFDRGYGIFVWSSPPLANGTATTFTIVEPTYSRWNALGFDQVGAPVSAQVTATSRYSTTASYQTFVNGGIYNITSGALSGKQFYLRRSVQALYESSQGPTGFLGFPIAEESVLADGRRRQSFEGGTMEYAVNGAPILKNAISSVVVAAEEPVRLSAGQSITLNAVLQTIAGETVTDRDVFWSTSNGRVAAVTGNGTRATIRGVAGGFATITATSEGKVSNRVTVQVAAQCCAIGEGAPSLLITQSFLDAVQRNRLSLRTPLASPVRRVGAGYVQQAVTSPAGEAIWIAKSDASPVAYIVQGAPLAAFEGLGSFGGSLGYPTTDLSAGGTQVFQGGALGGSPIRVVAGAILSRWSALGLEAGAIGPPTGVATSAITFTGNQITTQPFRSGFLVQHDTGSLRGRVLLISGVIAARYQQLGQAIGAPLTEEFLSASGNRQEFEGAFLEYNVGTSAVRVIDKARRPTLTVTPSTVIPGGRYRVAVGGFPQGATVRVTQASTTAQDTFTASTSSGALVWDGVAPADARSGVVLLRATLSTNADVFAEGSYAIRTLAELRPSLSKLAGDTQLGAPATVLTAPLRVQLRDSSGNPIGGVALRFQASPGATVLNASAATDANGIGEASLKLPAVAGVSLMTVEAGGQIVTFSARAAEQLIPDFPKTSQTTVGIGRDSLVAAMAGSIRFYQQRGVAPVDKGLADTALLASYLRNTCVSGVAGEVICDGFFDAIGNADPLANPVRALDFTSGALTLSLHEPALPAIRDAYAANGPVIVALDLDLNNVPSGTHHVVVTGILGDGDLAISDVNPQFGLTRLSQYLTGFTVQAGTWKARLAAAVQIHPATGEGPAFYAQANQSFAIVGPAGGCSRVAAWAGVFLQTCDGATAGYQLRVQDSAYQLNFVGLGSVASRGVVSGAAATAYRISKGESGAWTIGPERLSISTNGVVNAATFRESIAPGSIISIFGNGLPLGEHAANQVDLDGTVLPVFFSNGFQLNTALPVTAGIGKRRLNVRSLYGQTTIEVDMVAASPGIFLLNNASEAAAINQDGTVNSKSNPLARGQVIVIFGTGWGGVREGAGGLRVVTGSAEVVLDGRTVVPQFTGLTPGFVGLYQVNVQVPVNQPPGLAIPVVVRIDGAESNLAYIALR